MIRKYANALQINNGERWLTRIINTFITLNAIEERDTINETIKKIGRKIFVIIEDLDRLTAMEILEVLKIIDSNGNFCNTVFVTAYDKEYVNSVLKKNLGHEASQDFTDKYFNYEFTLPVQSPSKLTDYFKKKISEHLSVNKFNVDTQQIIIKAWNEESTIIIQKLKSIRHVKRFFNIFMSRYPTIKNDVNINDFLLLTLLRYKDINVYYTLVNGNLVSEDLLKGESGVIYLRENYAEELKHISTWNDCEEILKELFPLKYDVASNHNDYRCIRITSSFDKYFYIYEKSNYDDLKSLITTANDTEAFILIDNVSSMNFS